MVSSGLERLPLCPSLWIHPCFFYWESLRCSVSPRERGISVFNPLLVGAAASWECLVQAAKLSTLFCEYLNTAIIAAGATAWHGHDVLFACCPSQHPGSCSAPLGEVCTWALQLCLVCHAPHAPHPGPEHHSCVMWRHRGISQANTELR